MVLDYELNREFFIASMDTLSGTLIDHCGIFTMNCSRVIQNCTDDIKEQANKHRTRVHYCNTFINLNTGFVLYGKDDLF